MDLEGGRWKVEGLRKVEGGRWKVEGGRWKVEGEGEGGGQCEHTMSETQWQHDAMQQPPRQAFRRMATGADWGGR